MIWLYQSSGYPDISPPPYHYSPPSPGPMSIQSLIILTHQFSGAALFWLIDIIDIMTDFQSMPEIHQCMQPLHISFDLFLFKPLTKANALFTEAPFTFYPQTVYIILDAVYCGIRVVYTLVSDQLLSYN